MKYLDEFNPFLTPNKTLSASNIRINSEGTEKSKVTLVGLGDSITDAFIDELNYIKENPGEPIVIDSLGSLGIGKPMGSPIKKSSSIFTDKPIPDHTETDEYELSPFLTNAEKCKMLLRKQGKLRAKTRCRLD